MNFNLLEILIILTIFQLFVFAIILIMRKNAGHIYQYFLSLFFFSLAGNILNFLLFRKAGFFVSTWVVHIYYFGSPLAFVYAPAFYLYLSSFTTARRKTSKFVLLHFVPFALYMGYVLTSFAFLPGIEKRSILNHGGLLKPVLYQFLIVSVHLQMFLYAILGIRQILKYRSRLKNQFASVKSINFTWISSLLGAILCLWLIDLTRFFASYIADSSKTFLEISLFIGFILFCYFFLFKSITYRLVTFPEELQGDSKKLSLSELIRKKYGQQLEQFMHEQKPYLNPEITLVDLARNVNIPPRSLSEVINISFGQNFYDFINTYRIRESELLFTSNKDPNKTILEVLFEVGFNSKSSFNSAFKKLTGMTPTEYRRQQQLSQNVPQKRAV